MRRWAILLVLLIGSQVYGSDEEAVLNCVDQASAGLFWKEWGYERTSFEETRFTLTYEDASASMVTEGREEKYVCPGWFSDREFRFCHAMGESFSFNTRTKRGHRAVYFGALAEDLHRDDEVQFSAEPVFVSYFTCEP